MGGMRGLLFGSDEENLLVHFIMSDELEEALVGGSIVCSWSFLLCGGKDIPIVMFGWRRSLRILEFCGFTY